jgi:hypothetical protein
VLSQGAARNARFPKHVKNLLIGCHWLDAVHAARNNPARVSSPPGVFSQLEQRTAPSLPESPRPDS